jgi:low affinity Fe/Cu permease
MNSSTHPYGGDGLLFLVAMAVVLVVAAEGAFIAFSSWWLLGLVLLGAIGAAVGVVAALTRLMDDEDEGPRRTQGSAAA